MTGPEQLQGDKALVVKDVAYYAEVRRAVGRGAPTLLLGTSTRSLERSLKRLEWSGPEHELQGGEERAHAIGKGWPVARLKWFRGAPGGRELGLTPEPGSLMAIPRLWIAATFAASALFAGGVALFATNDSYRPWGSAAAVGYLLAAVAVLAWRRRGRDLALVFSLFGALLVPLAQLAIRGRQQPEVSVITRSTQLLIHHGTPYLSPAALAATHNPNSYDPYLPVMTLFGLPRVLLGTGVLTDPRIWFGLAFLVVFGLALAVAGARDWIRWTVFVAVTPVIALELAVSGTDVPVLALMCLGLALLGGISRHKQVLAALVLGVASSTGAIAWPALAVAFALLCVRDSYRTALRFIVVALAVVAVIVGPFAVLSPDALVENTILFPLGLAKLKPMAASPLPGHLLTQTGVIGHTAAVILLIGSGLAIAVNLVVRPPCDVSAATTRLVMGLFVAFTLAPFTQFANFIYLAGLVVWLLIVRASQRRHSSEPSGREGRLRWPSGSATDRTRYRT